MSSERRAFSLHHQNQKSPTSVTKSQKIQNDFSHAFIRQDLPILSSNSILTITQAPCPSKLTVLFYIAICFSVIDIFHYTSAASDHAIVYHVSPRFPQSTRARKLPKPLPHHLWEKKLADDESNASAILPQVSVYNEFEAYTLA